MTATTPKKMSTATKLRRYFAEIDRVVDSYKTEVEMLRVEYRNLAAIMANHQDRLNDIQARLEELEIKG